MNKSLKLLIIITLFTISLNQPYYPDLYNVNDHPWRDELDSSIVPSTSNEKNKFWVWGVKLGGTTDYIDQRSGVSYVGNPTPLQVI